ncbi:MAG TPA: nuclear transport factor 2 family protein [Candidatus Corynebacterium faecigallinarum]|uniref:Nuclear transport factor 2 family protein n=1 Tax=Candidatus Corynebacterium faecigallinarum TaxID=2838528 RepID=A0A9D2QCC0_9CORY|nr:nuclear transport factor 2 family protein [Candidatus Corynebacterium faecigallinarum]
MSSPDIPEPIDSFFTAVNDHHNEAFLDAFTADGVVDDWGQIITGRDKIDQWSQIAFIGSKPTFVAQHAIVVDGRIIVTGDWKSTHANGPSRFDFDLEGDKIKKMTINEG